MGANVPQMFEQGAGSPGLLQAITENVHPIPLKRAPGERPVFVSSRRDCNHIVGHPGWIERGGSEGISEDASDEACQFTPQLLLGLSRVTDLRSGNPHYGRNHLLKSIADSVDGRAPGGIGRRPHCLCGRLTQGSVCPLASTFEALPRSPAFRNQLCRLDCLPPQWVGNQAHDSSGADAGENPEFAPARPPRQVGQHGIRVNGVQPSLLVHRLTPSHPGASAPRRRLICAYGRKHSSRQRPRT